jgi:hypothetical protein
LYKRERERERERERAKIMPIIVVLENISKIFFSWCTIYIPFPAADALDLCIPNKTPKLIGFKTAQ